MKSFKSMIDGGVNKLRILIFMTCMIAGILQPVSMPVISGFANCYGTAPAIDTASSNIIIGGVYADEDDGSSGVTELDEAKKRTNDLVKWVCAWVGGLIALVSLIIALVMAASHQQEQRNQALAGVALGLMIAFAPQIIDYLLHGSSN